jgi:hypothetical protein
MPFAAHAPVDLALKERIRVAYYVESLPIAEMETVAGVGKATLYRWFDAWGWARRKPMRSRARKQGGVPVFRPGGETGTALAEPGLPGRRPASRDSLKARLTRLVEHRIGLLEQEAMAGIAVDPDANARAIELNARTLVTIERLAGEAEPRPNGGEARPQRSLIELRDQLYGHLRRISEEREAAGLAPKEDDVPVSGAGASRPAPLPSSP